jgi:glycerophosphoryl diester phosphodiesterase
MGAGRVLDRDTFLRPIAHRGLHDAGRGIVENSGSAFAAAIASGYGFECDLRPAAGGLPIVFHDETLDRLVEGSGPVSGVGVPALARLRYRDADEPILTFADLLDLTAGRAPMLVEVKSEWAPPDARFVAEIARLAAGYSGPIALMSFDPAVVAALRDLAPAVPRGIVSGRYRNDDSEGWWGHVLSAERQERLTHLLESGPAAPSFYAYHVKALPTPVTRFVREVLGLPLFSWTVRDETDRETSEKWADAPIFERLRP